VYTSPPVQGAARVRKGWGAGSFELRKQSQTKTKQNSIIINNIQYLLTVTEKKLESLEDEL